jgi:DNA-binding protein YbaB
MSQDGPYSLAEATAELRRQQERLQAVSTRLEEVKTKVMSKDGMITVTLDSQGSVSSVAFNTTKFRRMAPAELGAALVQVIKQAQTQARDEVMSAYRSFLPSGMGLDDLLSGKGDFNSMFDDAVRRAENMLAHGPAGDLRQAAAKRQSATNRPAATNGQSATNRGGSNGR